LEDDDVEEVIPDSQKLNFEKPDFLFIPKGNCQYRQEGPYLVCYGCELKHAIWIGMDKMLMGYDEKGQPIIKPRVKASDRQA
jgi:hypothetical protein